MKETDLLDLLDEITSTVGEILVTYLELQLESAGTTEPTDTAKKSVERIQTKLTAAKERLAHANDNATRKRKLEKLSRDNARHSARNAANESKSPTGRIQLLNGQGLLIGWLHNERNGKVTVYDAKGRLVARELAGITLDRTGRWAGRGRQGLVVLGQRLA